MSQLDVKHGNGALEPLHAVQDLDALRVGVVPDLEGPRHRRGPPAELLLRVLEAVRHVVYRLVVLVLYRNDNKQTNKYIAFVEIANLKKKIVFHYNLF